MTRTEPSWTRAFPLSALPANSARLFRQGSSQIALFHRAADPATGAGLLALHWRGQGYGYEITGADVRAALKKCQPGKRYDRLRSHVAPETGT